MKPRLSFANVTSVLALFVALGGTSYAAVTCRPTASTRATCAPTPSASRRSACAPSANPRSAPTRSPPRSAHRRPSARTTSRTRRLGVERPLARRPHRAGRHQRRHVPRLRHGGGALTAGNVAQPRAHRRCGVYTVETGRDVSACQYSADVAGVKNGATIEGRRPGLGDRRAVGHGHAGRRARPTTPPRAAADSPVQPARRLLNTRPRRRPARAPAAPLSGSGTCA